MEFTREVIDLLIAASEEELATLTKQKFVQQPDAQRRHDYSEMYGQLFGFLGEPVLAYQSTPLAVE
jgi:GMP synthase (glutamine-hydrolysing)